MRNSIDFRLGVLPFRKADGIENEVMVPLGDDSFLKKGLADDERFLESFGPEEIDQTSTAFISIPQLSHDGRGVNVG